MTEGEMLKLSVEEFSRIQGYMLLVEKESEAYKSMKIRYLELKSYTYCLWCQFYGNRQN